MKAAVYTRYGPPDVLQIKDAARPVPKDSEVLIQVRAASVNPLDWHFLRGTPYFLRIMAGLLKPKDTRLGVDVAGQVEAVGRSVMQFKPGDAVFGSCRGAFAEYVCAPESALAAKPENITFEQAASAPVAAFTALQALRGIEWGQRVLINGAAGGVGTFAVQIAKSFGADVTGVCSTRNVPMVRSIGADRVIDYTQEDFTTDAQRYDLFLDCIGNRSLSECRRVLTPNGRYVIIGGPNRRWFGLGRPLRAAALSPFLSQQLGMILAKPNQEDLATIRDLMASGKVTPFIDRSYSLAELPDAIRHLEQGHARGKVVITM
jgi:NADPH:quinone reductase-like Zn-dependent oxidoreductase